jgi:hypothetical protein
MFRRTNDPNYQLILFPEVRENGLEMWFHSSWSGEIILLVDLDLLKLCPMKQYWPYCSWCRKFLFPPDAHRASHSHTCAVQYIEMNGPDWCMARLMLNAQWYLR